MTKTNISAGTAHDLPEDMGRALASDARALAVWESLTPLTRNEWICWTTFVKKEETRTSHVERMLEDLNQGKRRPCCWLGCTHRTDKEISPSVRGILERRSKKVLK